MLFGLHAVDLLVVALYFAAIIYLGVYLGSKKTKNLGDFFVAGGKWGPFVSFIFVFASAIAGSEATVVGGKAYQVGLSGVWLWWNVLFATPIYFLFATYYKRARVYNLAEFLEMRYGKPLAIFYAVLAGISCLFQIGMIVLAIGKILSGFMGLEVQVCVWAIAIVVSMYIFAGGMMSALLTDLLQGVMCFFILGFVMLPFVWSEAGGMDALQALPKETWDFVAKDMSLLRVIALNFTGLVGGIAAPWIFNWIAISKDEKSGTQCAWAHLWKRVITLLFAFYGIFFAIITANSLADPELAWGVVMKQVLPVGVGIVGLMIATFFAAAMSSVDSYATIFSAMSIDYIYRKAINKGKSMKHYLSAARIWSVVSVLLAALATSYIDSVLDFLKLYLALMAFLGIPIYFGVLWRRANRIGMWMCVLTGMTAFLTIIIGLTGEGRMFANRDEAFVASALIPPALAFVMMWLGSMFGPREDESRLNRFYGIMNTPIGEEQRLVDAGIRLPLMVDHGIVEDEQESLNVDLLAAMRTDDGVTKVFGPESDLEIYRLPLSHWYVRGFLLISAGCIGLAFFTWLVLRIVFVW